VTEPNLLVVCAAAFTAVLLLLSLLAAMIRGLTMLFPAVDGTDAGLLAAITTAAARAYPESRITNIQEDR
jgi:hypothetical protein